MKFFQFQFQNEKRYNEEICNEFDEVEFKN